MVGILILTALAVVAAGVLHSQRSFHPPVLLSRSLHRLSPEKSPPAETAPAASRLVKAPPTGIALLGGAEIFTPSTLSDKINGKAELYLSAHVKGLKTQRFSPEGERLWWAEMFVYDMGESANAFSVFSMQRRDSGEPSALARHAYHTENALFLVHGPYYVEMVASTASEAVRQGLVEMAQRFLAENPIREPAPEPDTPSFFPEAGRIESSMERIVSDAFGFSRFDNVYTARYRAGGGEHTLFLSRRTTPEEAVALADAYVSFLLEFGGKRVSPESEPIADGGVAVVEILGVYEAVLTRGRHVAGVHEAPSADMAADLAEKLLRSLESKTL